MTVINTFINVFNFFYFITENATDKKCTRRWRPIDNVIFPNHFG